MDSEWLYTIASVVVVSLVSLIGIAVISVRQDTLNRLVFVLVSLAVGALFGDAVIHLLPEAFEESKDTAATSLYVVAGFFAFFTLEKFLRWRHCHDVCQEGSPSLHHVGQMNLVSDGLHNLIDGMIIAASYLVSTPVGVATTTAVLLHEVPQEIGDFGVLLHTGFSKSRALAYNFLSASAAIVGAVVVLIIGADAEDLSLVMLPLTAGAFLYIAGSDLVPELQKEQEPAKSLWQLLAISVGVGLMVLLLLID